MARLIKSGKNAGVIVLNRKDEIDFDALTFLDLCKQQVSMKRDEEAAFAQLVEDLGSVRAANRALRQS